MINVELHVDFQTICVVCVLVGFIIHKILNNKDGD